MSEKIFCGAGKEIETKYGSMLKLSFSKTDLEKLADNLNESGWVNAVVKSRKNPTENQTHYIEIDNWKPAETYKSEERDDKTEEQNDKAEEDLPF